MEQAYNKLEEFVKVFFIDEERNIRLVYNIRPINLTYLFTHDKI